MGVSSGRGAERKKLGMEVYSEWWAVGGGMVGEWWGSGG